MLLTLICLGVLATSMAIERPYYDLEEVETLFENFIVTHGKTYHDNAEKQKRFEIFKENLKIINEKNAENLAVFGINKFTDLTAQEVVDKYTGLNVNLREPPGKCKVLTDKDITTHDAPDELNWVTKGAVTAVKNQGVCGSCWAFGTVGNIEGQYFLKYGNLTSFSEQELVDCSTNNSGCNGGWMTIAMSDLMQIGGLQTESSYPYVGRHQTCQVDKSKFVARLTGCYCYNLSDENKLKELLAKTGPLSIAVDAEKIHAYQGHVFPASQCKVEEIDINHAVLLVGYGTDPDSKEDYWLVKNSWGADWGENGYIRLKRNENTCYLLNDSMSSAQL